MPVDPEGAEKRERGCLSYSPIYFYIAPSIINARVRVLLFKITL